MAKNLVPPDERQFDVDYWRTQFASLLAEIDDPRQLRSDLARVDDWFATTAGTSAVSNTKKGMAGLQATRRVVQAMRQLPRPTPQ